MTTTKTLALGILALIASAVASAEIRADQEALNQNLRQVAMAGVIPRIEQLIQQGTPLQDLTLH